MKRRDLLKAMAGLAASGVLAPLPAWALGDASKVDIAEIVLPKGTVSRPAAWQQLLYELVQTTSIEAVDRVATLPPDDITLFNHPFAVLAGDAAFAPLDDVPLEQLTRYLTYGGFLFIVDTTGAEDSDFDRSVRRLCSRLYPTKPLSPLPADHSVFRSFFLNPRPVGRVSTHSYLEGITDGETSPLIYCRNDVSGALLRGEDGRHAFPTAAGGSRIEALKLGINLVMYALTSNYKKDQAHVRQLILEGRIE